MLTIWSGIGLALTALLCWWAADPRLAQSWSGLAGVRRLGEPLESLAERRATLLAVAVLGLGVVLRVGQLWLARNAALPEEIWTALEARALWQTGQSLEGVTWPAVLPGWANTGEVTGPLLAWLAMLPLAVLPHAAAAVRLPMFIIQTLAMWAAWDLLRRAFSRDVALWALLLTALSPWQLMQCRWAQSWQLLPCLLMLALWLLTRERRRTAFTLSGLAVLALTMYTGDVSWHVVPLLALLSVACLWRQRALRWPQALAALAVFAVLAAPALYARAAQTWPLPERRVLGLTAGPMAATESPAHAQDGVAQVYSSYTSSYSGNVPDQAGLGWQLLPWLRDEPQVAALPVNLLSSGLQLLKSTVFQFADDAGYTTSHFLPEHGYLYLFTIPLACLGALLCLVRALQKWPAEQGSPRRVTALLLAAWVLAALPFLLGHVKLSLPHYAVLFYPLVLATAGGAAYVARRVRLAGAVLVALALVSAGLFGGNGYDPAPTFPGLADALAHARAGGLPRVAVTTRLYPSDAPHQAAALETIGAFELSPAYVRGETELPRALPFAERFAWVYFPSYTVDAGAETAYVMHVSEAEEVAPEEFAFTYFGDFVVVEPTAVVSRANP